VTPDPATVIAAIEAAAIDVDTLDDATTGAEQKAWGNCAIALANALDEASAALRAYEATIAANQRPEGEERYP
jgi:ketopantoate reductase